MTITDTAMTMDEVLAVADGAGVRLSDQAVASMRASRRVVDDAVARGDAVYGVTTGVGHARDERLPADALAAAQSLLLDTHAGALGDPLPRRRVRAGMAVRLNGFARGGAGVSPEVAVALSEFLNHGLHPVVPSSGSVGAGDLGQLAVVGRALLGRGSVEVDGLVVDAATALDEAGLAPVSLRPKDGLALMSSNALSIGHGALLVRGLQRLADVADLVAATSMDVAGANPSVVDPAVARAAVGDGARTSARTIRAALDAREPTGRMSVQDPLSFRVVPQVHGAHRDALTRLAAAVEAELHARSDNPLVDVASGRILSNGNFHPMTLALAAESVRVALAHVGLLAERRMGHLWDAVVGAPHADGEGPSGPPQQGGPPPALAGLALRYPAAAAYTRLRHLANPITLDVPQLDLAVEDHATNVAQALATTDESVAIVHDLLAVELLIAVASRGPDPGTGLGRGTGSLVTLVTRELDGVAGTATPDEIHRRTSGILRDRAHDVILDLEP